MRICSRALSFIALAVTRATHDTFAGLGAEVMQSTPDSTGAYIRSELAKWTKVIRASGLKAE